MNERPRSVGSAPGLMTSAVRIFDLSLGQMLWSRRSVFLGILLGGPVMLAVILRIVDSLHASGFRVNGAAVSGSTVFGMMIWLLFIRFIVPVLGVFYGTALIADEVEDKTITYLFTRPIPRGAVLLGKYLAYLACTVLLVLPSVMLVFFLIVPTGGGSIGAAFPGLAADLGMLVVGLASYGAVFALVGTRLKRPLVVGLVFAHGCLLHAGAGHPRDAAGLVGEPAPPDFSRGSFGGRESSGSLCYRGSVALVGGARRRAPRVRS